MFKDHLPVMPLPPWRPKIELKNFPNTMIMGYLQAENDYNRPFYLFYTMVPQDYAQKVASQFDQNLRHSGEFCNFHNTSNKSLGINFKF